MTAQAPIDPLTAYRALFANAQPRPALPGSAPGTTPSAPGLAELAAALQALRAAKARQPSRHIANMEPGESDHGNVSSVGRMPPPGWVHER